MITRTDTNCFPTALYPFSCDNEEALPVFRHINGVNTHNLGESFFSLSTKGALERMKVLVITACTAEKQFQPDNQLKPADFVSCEHLERRSRELGRYETPAAQMYTGKGHLRLMNGVKDLRHTFGRGIVDVRIISPGYGLLNEEDPIVPYDYTFDGQGREEIRQRSQRLGIHPKVKDLLSSYDLAFFLLGKDYVTACILPFHVPDSATQIFLVAPALEFTIPVDRRYIHAVCAGMELVDQLAGANNFNLKGFVFERLCTVACDRGKNRTGNGCTCDRGNRVFEEVKQNPQRMIEMVLSGTE